MPHCSHLRAYGRGLALNGVSCYKVPMTSERRGQLSMWLMVVGLTLVAVSIPVVADPRSSWTAIWWALGAALVGGVMLRVSWVLWMR